MGDLFDEFGDLTVASKNQTIADLFECQKAYAQLIREYKEEFEYIQCSLAELREEQRNFYEIELPKIIEVLNCDEVEKDAQRMWIDELQKSMSKSFQMSEKLMNDLAIKQMDEFKKEAEKILKEGK